MPLNISDIDKNFKVDLITDKENIKFYSVDNKPFEIYGVFKENGSFKRLPEEIAKNVSQGVYHLHSHTAGGRVRFKTNSRFIHIIAKMHNISKMSHFSMCGSSGFDLYTKENGIYDYKKTFRPPLTISDGFESYIDLQTNELRDITINFPLYSGINDLFVGIESDSILDYGDKYSCNKKILYYGSSITQGGCASRPGNSYQSVIMRRFDCDYVNLGFSGSAKAEDEMINYINSLDFDIFVYDYDHNSPSVEHLNETHNKMFSIIRESHPDTPIIILTRPDFYLKNKEEDKRAKIIKKTYTQAKKSGDKNVYYIDGPKLMKYAKNEGTVDGCHPNDLGFYSMAKTIGDLLEKII